MENLQDASVQEKTELDKQIEELKNNQLTQSEKNIIKQMPGIIFAISNYLDSFNNRLLTRAEGFLTEFNKNDLTIKANPNLNEGITREPSSNTRRLANSFQQAIEVCKKMDEGKNLEPAQRIIQLEEEKKQLSTFLFPNQPYNFQSLQEELKRLKIQDLTIQIPLKKRELEQSTNNLKNNLGSAGKYLLEKFLKKQLKLLENNDNNSAKLEELKQTLNEELNANQESLQNLLTKQVELHQLEKHLVSLQQNTEQVAQIQQNISFKK